MLPQEPPVKREGATNAETSQFFAEQAFMYPCYIYDWAGMC